MKIQSAVRQETARIALGTALLSLCMLAVFALLHRLDVTVVLGTLLGACAAVGNFFLLAMSVQRAAERMQGVTLPPRPVDENGEEIADAPPPDSPQIAQAKQRMQLSYTGRMLGLAAVGILALACPLFHPVATALALLFPRIVIFLYGALLSKKKEV